MKPFRRIYDAFRSGGYVWTRGPRTIVDNLIPFAQVTREDGTLMACANGGYPIVYFSAKPRGMPLCAKCAQADNLVEAGLYFEGKPIACYACGTEMESAYGNPWGKEKA